MENKNLEFALTKELCPVCTKEVDGPIVMNKILSPSIAKKVKEFHGKAIGWKKTPCEKCTDKGKDIIYMIGIDPEKSNSNEGINGMYRTGTYIGIAKKVADDIIKNNKSVKSFVKKHKFFFATQQAIDVMISSNKQQIEDVEEEH